MSSLPEHDEFSTRAVPSDARVASFRVAAVASMVSFSLPTFIAGIDVSSGVGPGLNLAAILGGALVIFLIGWLRGSIGAEPALTLIYWFAWRLEMLARAL